VKKVRAARAKPAKRRVFLDTGIFVAFLDRSDRWHADARALFGGDRVAWTTSLLVVSEAHSWFLHRLGEEPARTFQELLRTLDGLKLLEGTRAHHERVLRVLDRFRGSKLTYVDASSLAFLEEQRIDRVWGTDRHLSLTGAEVLPV
jgi:predicted nucleic acid-binding protein